MAPQEELCTSSWRAGELAAFDASLSGLDHVGAVLVAALVAPDLPGGVDIEPIEPGRDGVGALLVVGGPRLLAEEPCDAIGDRRAIGGLSAGLKLGSLG